MIQNLVLELYTMTTRWARYGPEFISSLGPFCCCKNSSSIFRDGRRDYPNGPLVVVGVIAPCHLSGFALRLIPKLDSSSSYPLHFFQIYTKTTPNENPHIKLKDINKKIIKYNMILKQASYGCAYHF